MNRLRLAGWLLPPLGLILLWRRPDLRLGRKLLGTLGLALWSLAYAIVVVLGLIQFAGLEIEWRGGFPPVLTFSKTRPDYAAVEAHRATQSNAPSASVAATNAGSIWWSGFRGPHRDGHYTERPLRAEWPQDGLKPLWRQPCGGGYGSFSAAQGRAFTLEQRRDEEVVVAYDLATGRELWAHRYPAHFSESMGGDGPRSTPTWDDGRVFNTGAEGEFCCLDAATGRLLWRTNVLREAGSSKLYFGQSASPLIVEDKVIVLAGEAGTGTVLAYDKRTGRRLWAALNEKQAYNSPMLVPLAGRRQLLFATASRVLGMDPADGAVLWSHPWSVQYDNAIAQPVVVSSNRFLLSAGYGTGSLMLEVTNHAGRFSAREVWRNKHLKNKFNSSVHWEGHLYGLDEGILTCLDAATGERRWKEGRYGYGQLVVTQGRLIILTGEGDMALVRATPERHEELARFTALRGKTWNHPALADGLLLVRNAAEMACFDLRP
jgi:outer membrane protein assembly factor BamB